MARFDDSRLVVRAQLGDDEAFQTLVSRYMRHVYAMCRHVLHNPEDARDAVQETFLSAYLNLPQLNSAGRFAAWLRRIARNSALRLLRGQRSDLPLRAFAVEADGAASPHESYEREEMRNGVREALMRLPDASRLALTMRLAGGLSYREIARFLNLPVSTVRGRLHRAKAQLRDGIASELAEHFARDRLTDAFAEDLFRLLGRVRRDAKAILPPDLRPENIVLPEITASEGIGGEWRAIHDALPLGCRRHVDAGGRIEIRSLPRELRARIWRALQYEWVVLIDALVLGIEHKRLSPDTDGELRVRTDPPAELRVTIQRVVIDDPRSGEPTTGKGTWDFPEQAVREAALPELPPPSDDLLPELAELQSDAAYVKALKLRDRLAGLLPPGLRAEVRRGRAAQQAQYGPDLYLKMIAPQREGLAASLAESGHDVAGGVTERFHDMSVPQLRALNRLFSAMNAGVICSTISLPAEIEDFSGAELAMHFEPKKVVVQHWAFQGKVPAGWCWEA